jgi:Tol biopolymer transport system component
MKKLFFFLLLFIFSPLLFSQQDLNADSEFRTGHPDDKLPAYIKKVCGFGERPDWSHDGKRILFVDKPMGEVYELEIATGMIVPKTRHFSHYGFTRALYMSNGDILLSGPVEQFDPMDAKSREIARDLCWLSVLDKSCTKPPVPLSTLCAEGPALSRTSLKVAYTHRDRQKPELGKNSAVLLIADIVYTNGTPKLENERIVFDSHNLPFSLGNASLEVQNLVPPDNKRLTFTVYTINNKNNTDTYILNPETGEYKPMTDSPGYYDEAEGIFPDGNYTCVEHGSSLKSAWPLIDLYKLKLDGSGQMQRLTRFTEYKGYKASQGVVSDDGKFLCFQIGKSGDEAGVGYGFYVMNLKEAEKFLEPFRSFNK